MKIILPTLFIAMLLTISCSLKTKDVAEFSTDRVLDENVEKIKAVAEGLGDSDKFPRNISHNKKAWNLVGVKDWCSGFWPGELWYSYEYSGDESLKAQAMRFTEPLEPIAYRPAENHDIGFILYSSYGNGYRLTKNEAYKKVLLTAADTLATLYNPKVGSILSWPTQTQYKHNTIIDNMMNLELLFWASKNGGSHRLYDIAESHARVTMEHLVRDDGSLYHLGSFDSETGEFIKGMTHQGYSDESMWARGQAWGIYGFAIAYRETRKDIFLDTAVKVADHYLERLPEDGVPYWDFDDPKIPDAPKDASASAIAACGLLELSALVDDKSLEEKYVQAANRFVKTLSSENYLSGETNQALLLHSTGHHPRGTEMDVPIIYADYYYMEALMRLRKLEKPSGIAQTAFKIKK